MAHYLAGVDVGTTGARCMIFGSGLPVFDPNAALMQVTHARLSPEEKRLVARENLAELLAGVRQP